MTREQRLQACPNGHGLAWRAVLSMVLLTLWFPRPAAGQDLLSIAPQAATVEHEDAQVRVLRLQLAPHAALPRHHRPARVVVSLTPNDARVTDSAGTERRVRTQAGEVAWGEPISRTLDNLSAQPLENLIVELKLAGAPAAARSQPPSPRPPDYLDEPLHRWVFENQYVRVFDVRIPQGRTTAFHLHALDAVYVHVSGGRVASQVQGGPWGDPENLPAGTVRIAADARRPFTHRVRNAGSAELHLVAVQLLR